MEKMMWRKHPHKVTTNQIHSEKTSQTLKQVDEELN